MRRFSPAEELQQDDWRLNIYPQDLGRGAYQEMLRVRFSKTGRNRTSRQDYIARIN